jgi:hypothetical protein
MYLIHEKKYKNEVIKQEKLIDTLNNEIENLNKQIKGKDLEKNLQNSPLKNRIIENNVLRQKSPIFQKIKIKPISNNNDNIKNVNNRALTPINIISKNNKVKTNNNNNSFIPNTPDIAIKKKLMERNKSRPEKIIKDNSINLIVDKDNKIRIKFTNQNVNNNNSFLNNSISKFFY